MSAISLRADIFDPWLLEEEGEIPETSEVSGVNEQETDFLKALEKWVRLKKSGNYKFISILLNTETSDIEKSVKGYILANPNMLRDESGEHILVLHAYIKSKKKAARDVIRTTYEYIKNLDVNRLSLPSLVIFPGPAFARSDNAELKTLIMNIGHNSKKWEGNLQEYFTIYFRCLFDVVDELDSAEKNPAQKLDKEFRKRFKTQFGTSLPGKATAIANMPVIGHIIKLLALLL